MGGGRVVIDQQIDASAVAAQAKRLTITLQETLIDRVGHFPDGGLETGPVLAVGAEIGEDFVGEFLIN